MFRRDMQIPQMPQIPQTPYYSYDPLFGYQQQRPIQQPQIPTNQFLKGKWIKSPDDVMPRDIPDDGSIAVFPMADFSQIIAKAWRSDGTIEEVKYVPVEQKKPEQPDTNQMILGQLAQHGQALEQIMEMLSPKKQVRKEQTP